MEHKEMSKGGSVRLEMIRFLANKGDAAYQHRLAEALDMGTHCAPDSVEAAEWYRRAAAQGYAPSQFQIGAYRLYGSVGFGRDIESAVELLKKSADQNFAKAQYLLGRCYLHGKGVTQDDTLAAGLFKSAAAQGYKLALAELGRCYLTGSGVPKDVHEAQRLFRMAHGERPDYMEILYGLK